MPINWQPYDAFDWQHSQQGPMDAQERSSVEKLAWRVLRCETESQDHEWGTASPPGRFAATVIHVRSNVAHQFRDRAETAGIRQIGLKIYKTNADASREFQKVAAFHNDLIHRFPGLPNPHVQQTLCATREQDEILGDRNVVVQEWVEGITLDVLLKSQSSAGPLPAAVARTLLEQIIGEVIIPLWSLGVIWWDIRDANWCYDPEGKHLSLIDVDSLAAYADEILYRPHEWQRRLKGRETALSRLWQTVWRIFREQVDRNRTVVERQLKQAWLRDVEPRIRELGLQENQSVVALTALHQFLDFLFSTISSDGKSIPSP